MLEGRLLHEQGANQYKVNQVFLLLDVQHAAAKLFELYFLVFA
jgi:hypothetical protein